jgi:membrane-associated phospholipid phosphatase
VRHVLLAGLLLSAVARPAQAQAPEEPAADASEAEEDDAPPDVSTEQAGAPTEIEAREEPPAPPPEEPFAEGRSPDDIRAEDVVGNLGPILPGMQGRVGPDAPPRGRLFWRPEWPRYEFDELVLTAGAGLVIFLREVLPTSSGDPNWVGGGFLDDASRDLLRLDDGGARRDAAIASDIITGLLVAWPFAIDAFLTAGLGEEAWDVAWQMALVSLEAVAISHAVVLFVKLLARRETPLATACGSDPMADPTCPELAEDRDPSQVESFYSEHAAGAFTSASLICLQHDVLDLFGARWADATTCATGMLAAISTGLLRVMSDRNYLSDVIVGAATGLIAGYLFPWLLHYRGGNRPAAPEAPRLPPLAILPFGSADTIGIQVAGVL